MDEYKDKYKQHAKEMYEKYGYGFGKPRRSAFDQVVNTREEVDGDYLRNLMPNSNIPIRTNHMAVIEADCIKYMVNCAKAKRFDCRYTVPLIFPGLPRYDPIVVMEELYKRLIKRDGLAVYADKNRDHTLYISWHSTESDGTQVNPQPKTHRRKHHKTRRGSSE